jgi:putative ABC transport system permease protein
MQSIRDNLYQAWRAWIAAMKRGGSSLPVILTLAFAIGATTAIFVLVNGVLTVLPYPHADELSLLWETSAPNGPAEMRVSIPDYEDFLAQSRTFAHLELLAPGPHNIEVGEGVERVSAPQVSTGFFSLLGIRMLKGRGPVREDTSAIVLSEGLWRDRFPGWADPIGKTVRVDGVDKIVIGVVSAGEEFPQTAKMWLPFSPSVENCSCKRNGHSYKVVGRLRPGVSVAEANTEVKGIAARLAAQFPDTNTNTSAWVQPLKESLVGDIKPAMWMLIVATSSLLLMACISIATILFAQGAHRGPEIAMRQVLGASRGRIVIQLLMESCFSAILASAVGLICAWWVLRLFLRIMPASLPHMQAVSIDYRAAIFAVIAALVTVVFFSVVPAFHSTRANLSQTVRGVALSTAMGRPHRVRNVLIVVENTITFALLVSSMLLLNSLIKLTNVDPGFQREGLISGDLSPSPEKYATPAQAALLFQNLLERVRALPGVESAAVVDSLPMTGSTEGTGYYPIGYFHKRPGEEPIGRVTFVSSGYFRTMNMPIIRGRDFSGADEEHSHVMVVSEGLAKANWQNEDPVGKRIGIKGADKLAWEVIGVVPDIKDDGLAAPSPQRLYLNEQEFGEKEMTVVVRTSGDPNSLVASLRHEVSSLDRALPIYNIKTVVEVVNSSMARNQMITRIVVAFSAMALLLAVIGVYGVILSNLVRRTREFGVRIAIGAGFRHIAWLVLREGLFLVLIGMVAGTVVAFLTSRTLSSLLFGVREVDVFSYAVAGAAQVLVVVGGCAILLRKITRLDPLITLKNG